MFPPNIPKSIHLPNELIDGKALLKFLWFVTIEGVGLEKIFVFGLKAGGSSEFSSLILRFTSRGGSLMNSGNLPKVYFFLPGPAGLN